MWCSLAVWKEKDCLRLPPDCLPIEYGALLRELFLAYRLLEDHAQLKVGGYILSSSIMLHSCVYAGDDKWEYIRKYIEEAGKICIKGISLNTGSFFVQIITVPSL